MSSFEPIAIIGQGCVLPGAHSPAALWQAVARGSDLTSEATSEDWGIAIERVLTAPGGVTTDRTWSNRGGYIRGFEQTFDPDNFVLERDQVAQLDPGVQWCLHAAREALLDAGLAPFAQQRDDVGVILGNLAYAPRSMQDYTARFWLNHDAAHPDANERSFSTRHPADLAAIAAPPAQRFFSAAAPAQVTARAIGAGGSAFCLDAACASSLYAIKLACEQLQDGKAKLMLAGAVNHADDLYLHIGFTALQALSKSGVARPFDQRADGLVPGAGAAVVALKRLVDARRDGDTIHGVIRGIGLANDGRAGGFLSPSADGQVQAIAQAYQQCTITPAEVSYLECHATGTTTGDATELRSIQRVFGSRSDLALASLKGNIGHLITAAGAAGLIRLLGAMQHGQLARSIHVEKPIAGLAGSDLQLVREQQTWSDREPRIAGLNAFGFGGNNAHMIVQQTLAAKQWPIAADLKPRSNDHCADDGSDSGHDRDNARDSVVITALKVRAARCANSTELVRQLLSPVRANEGRRSNKDSHPNEDSHNAIDSIDIPLPRLGFPPSDLEHTLGQQLLIMQLVRDLANQATGLDHQRTSILVGMGTDPNTTRYATRTRLAQWLTHWREHGLPCDDAWFEQAKTALTPGLTAAGVLGTMPNIPANRSNHQLDLRGPSYTIAAEELGGIHCLHSARRSLQQGDIDAAIVGAVDLSHDSLYQHALHEALGIDADGDAALHVGDAAVALLVKRKGDALRDGDTIIAELGDDPQRCSDAAGEPAPAARPAERAPQIWGAQQAAFVRAHFGHSHAAFGLLNTAVAALMLQHRLTFDGSSDTPAPNLTTEPVCWALQLHALDVNGGGARVEHLTLRAPAQARAIAPATEHRLYRFAGPDRASLSTALRAGHESDEGSHRLAIIANSDADFTQKQTAALTRLNTEAADSDSTGVQRLLNGVYLACSPLPGELGFVFTGAASAYPGMGRELLMALPDSVATTLRRFPVLANSQAWLAGDMPTATSEFAVLQGCSLLSQIHASITRDLLKLQPQAMLGVSSGETNSMFAAGAWHDMDAMFREIDESGMYQRWIAGDFQAARQALNIDHHIAWQAYRVIAPAERLAALLAQEQRVFLTMINAHSDCVVGGESKALARVLPAIEALARAVVPLGHDIIAHCPLLKSWEAPWRTIHSRHTTATPGIRFYANASGNSYQAERAAIATALTDQATAAVDFRQVVEAAYADGVRIFVEHGPRSLCSQWVSDTLGTREHLSVHLDRPGAGVAPLFETVAQLWCAGVAVDYKVLETMHSNSPSDATANQTSVPSKRLPAHPPPISWPPLSSQAAGQPNQHRQHADDSSMPPAPALSSVLQAARADDAGTLHAIKQALLSAPPPSYAMPERPVLPISTGAPANGSPAQVEQTQRMSTLSDAGAAGADLVDTVDIDTIDMKAAATVEATLNPGLVAAQASASGLVQRLHQQLGESHQHYLSLQQGALSQLLSAHAAFTGLTGTVASAPAGAAPAASAAATPSVTPRPGTAALNTAPNSATVARISAPANDGVAPPLPEAKSAAWPTPPAEPATALAPPSPSANSSAASEASKTSAASAADTTMDTTAPARTTKPARTAFPGPQFDRQQLEILAGGTISEVLGPLFKQQDGYQRQVRMPCPPLLLADRVLGIDATPGAMETTGTIWTETDVSADAWYLHHGHMPAGIMIESGQADLLLISWMGADFENRGERVYRLLGCELTYRAGLPAIDDTLRYDIHVDGYAKQGDVRLFFFHYNCEIAGQRRLEVRHGQAGFFTYEELANSAGIIWDAASEQPRSDLSVDPVPCASAKQQFTSDDVQAFADGDLLHCFGPGFEPACCHQRTPTIAAGKMQLFDRVTALDHRGGPWQRGYIRAELDVLPDHWFFDGHFKNDPCMPGTLMFEGGMQVMAFYLASLGFTLPRDGWRFEPVKDEAFKLLCRSQLIPGARQLVCELFVHGVEGGTTPRLRADMLCSVDGRKAFLGQSVGIELVPGWPQESRRHLLTAQPTPDVACDEDFRFDEQAMVACAWGRPSQAFGPHYARHDGPRRGPRLPGYPYHFISRVIDLEASARTLHSGGRVSVEYDVPGDAWYFAENSQATMPFPVLLEAALQPCGWLATYIGGGFEGDSELFFRNLDGTATWHRDVLPDAGRLRTEVENTSVSQVGSMTILGFKVLTSQQGQPVYEMETVFGFFPEAALADQAGLPTTDEERRAMQTPGSAMRALRQRDSRLFQHSLRLPGPMLCLLDRITDLQTTDTGDAPGQVRAEMDVDPQAWYFKSHFYGDPVQPGSLGLEMMLQCLQYFAIDQDLGAAMARPRFAAVARPHSWSYRGQVLPHNKVVTCALQVTGVERSAEGITLTADATLWADGTKIYRADQLSLAIIDADPQTAHAADVTLDRHRDQWLNDHCPTWTVPALPMTCMLDQLAAAAAQRSPGKQVMGLADVRASRWLDFNEPVRYLHSWAKSVSASRTTASLLAWATDTGSYETIAEGTVLLGEQYRFAPAPWPALEDAADVPLPYAGGALFHGPAFQGMRALKISRAGASSRVDAGHSTVPKGFLNPGFIDACLHGIPHDNLQQWFPELEPDVAAYPLLVLSAAFYGPTPTEGLFRVEARPRGLHAQWRLPHIALQIIDGDEQLWAELELLEAVLPKGPLGTLDPLARRAFIVDRQYQAGARLSERRGAHSELSIAQTRASNWLPGTLEDIYQSTARAPLALTRDIVAKEHIGHAAQVHPSQVLVSGHDHDQEKEKEPDQTLTARLPDNLLLATPLLLLADDERVRVTSQATRLDLRPVRDYWREQLAKPEGLEEDLFLSLACRFVSALCCADDELLNRRPAQGEQSERSERGVLFLANHQVGVESMLFSILMGGFMGQNIVTLAKQEHRDSWIGRMLQALFDDAPDAPDLLHLLNRDDPGDVLKQMTSALSKVAAGKQSLLVHAEGTRALKAGQAVSTVSTALIGAAVAADVDIVPLAFRGGLPVAGVTERLEFPIGYGQQQFVVGQRISSSELRSLTALEQKQRVLAALNPLLTDAELDHPHHADPAFAEAVAALVAQRGVNAVQAALWLSLNQSALPLSSESQRLIQLAGAGDGSLSSASQPSQHHDHWLTAVSEVVFGR